MNADRMNADRKNADQADAHGNSAGRSDAVPVIGPQPGGEVKPEGLVDLLRPVRIRLIVGCIVYAVGSVASVVPFIAVAELGREALSPGVVDPDRIRWLARLAIVALLARGTLQFAASLITHFADNDLQLHIRRRIASHLMLVPLGWFSANSSGRVKRAVGDDVTTMHHVVAHALLDLTAAIVAPVTALVYLGVVDWRLPLAALAPASIGIGLYAWQMSVGMRSMEAYEASLGDVTNAAIELVSGIAVVKTFGTVGQAHDRFRDASNTFVKFFWDMVRGLVRPSAATDVVLSPFTVLVSLLAIGTWFVDRSWIDPGEAVALVTLGVGLTSPVLLLGHTGMAMRQASSAAARTGELLATATLPIVDASGVGEAGIDGAVSERLAGSKSELGETDVTPVVRIENVSFSYDNAAVLDEDSSDVLALDGLTLDMEPGTLTALVGRSGSGKTTVARLIARYWDVTSGAVRVGGVDVRDLSSAELYAQVGFVFQDVQLLHLSIAENIRLGRPEATPEEVEYAARSAQIHDRIVDLEDGYESVVGVNARLSSGERQRVTIARALLADAPVLVFDEATAFADPESEAAIQDALSELASGRTVLVIAHRLSTIMNADQIVVLEAGRLAEQGTHHELLEANGIYRRMWDASETGGVA